MFRNNVINYLGNDFKVILSIASIAIAYYVFIILNHNSIREEEKSVIVEIEKALELVNDVAIACALLYCQFIKSGDQRNEYYKKYNDKNKILNESIKIDLSYKKDIADKVDALSDAIINLSKNNLLARYLWTGGEEEAKAFSEKIPGTDIKMTNIKRDPVEAALLLQIFSSKLRDQADEGCLHYLYGPKLLADFATDSEGNKFDHVGVRYFITLCAELDSIIGYEALTLIISCIPDKRRIVETFIENIYSRKITRKRLKGGPLNKLIENSDPRNNFGETLKEAIDFIKKKHIAIPENIRKDIGNLRNT